MSRSLRVTLGTLLAFMALNAFGGSWYGLAGAKQIPREWLRGSPFADYFVPSLILGVVVGGSFLLAALAVWMGWRAARLLTIGAGVVVLGWLAVQVSIIGYVSWMQPAVAVVALGILALAQRIPAA